MRKIRMDATLYICLALGLLLLPFSWVFAAALAAIFHELGHWSAAKWRKVFLQGMSVSSGGMVMHMGCMTRMDVLLVSAAGPGASLLLGSLLRVCPQVAVCGMVQGLYNLLPIYPLDGGRILHALIGDRANRVEKVFVFMVLIIGIVVSIQTELGFSALLFSLLVCGRAIQRKFPCKDVAIGVQ